MDAFPETLSLIAASGPPNLWPGIAGETLKRPGFFVLIRGRECVFKAFLFCAMRTAINCVVLLHSMAYNPSTAVRTGWRESMNCTLLNRNTVTHQNTVESRHSRFGNNQVL